MTLQLDTLELGPGRISLLYWCWTTLPNFLLYLSVEQMLVLSPFSLYTEVFPFYLSVNITFQNPVGGRFYTVWLTAFQVVCFEWESIPRLLRRLGNRDRWPFLSLSHQLINGGLRGGFRGGFVRFLLCFCMKRFRNLSMEGVGLALRSVITRVKDATAKRSSVSLELFS